MVKPEIKRQRRRAWEQQGFSKLGQTSQGVDHDEIVERFNKFSQREAWILNKETEVVEGYDLWLKLCDVWKSLGGNKAVCTGICFTLWLGGAASMFAGFVVYLY